MQLLAAMDSRSCLRRQPAMVGIWPWAAPAWKRRCWVSMPAPPICALAVPGFDLCAKAAYTMGTGEREAPRGCSEPEALARTVRPPRQGNCSIEPAHRQGEIHGWAGVCLGTYKVRLAGVSRRVW